MPRLPIVVLLFSVVLFVGCADERAPRPETAALDRVIPTALTALDGARKGEGPYRLIGAQQFVFEGRWIWRVTFKAEEHLPADPARDMLTAGGEIFVNVDAGTGEATVRYGE